MTPFLKIVWILKKESRGHVTTYIIATTHDYYEIGVRLIFDSISCLKNDWCGVIWMRMKTFKNYSKNLSDFFFLL